MASVASDKSQSIPFAQTGLAFISSRMDLITARRSHPHRPQNKHNSYPELHTS